MSVRKKGPTKRTLLHMLEWFLSLWLLPMALEVGAGRKLVLCPPFGGRCLR